MAGGGDDDDVQRVLYGWQGYIVHLGKDHSLLQMTAGTSLHLMKESCCYSHFHLGSISVDLTVSKTACHCCCCFHWSVSQHQHKSYAADVVQKLAVGAPVN